MAERQLADVGGRGDRVETKCKEATVQIRSESLKRFGGLSVATLFTNWMGTLKYKAAFHPDFNDPASVDFQPPAIYLIWHEYIPVFMYLRGFCNIAMLASRHQDAEWLTQAIRFVGFSMVRGSTNRGGVRALREMMRKDRGTSFGISPDGPRGPRRKVTAGAIFLASKMEIPMVCVGVGYDRPWRIRRTWDQFAVPRPFSRARAVVGPKMYVPKKLGRAKLEVYQQHVEQTMMQLTESAETWAESGRDIECGAAIERKGLPLGIRVNHVQQEKRQVATTQEVAVSEKTRAA